MLREWLVTPQGLKNAPASFDHMASHVVRPLYDFVPSYFDDIFVHSRLKAISVEIHLRHLKHVFQVMGENKIYVNLKKCVFCAPEISVLGSYVDKKGQCLGMPNYIHEYTKDETKLIQSLSNTRVGMGTRSPKRLWLGEEVLDVHTGVDPADYLKRFHVMCDACDFAIVCTLMQFDDEDRE
ncbi:Retrotransposon Polyprotein [Phytophthora megakarya]|uniref:Retrotransposon Polyprotein n=1 Tax=Phytophthora megakarya TaxID=4795 RepID=A0A225W8U1_9STRA|nr:Retrotransposon Polyprotein [Phytophthora megakarya]